MIAALGALAGTAAGVAPAAGQPVDLELVLAVDASGSVDAQEFLLQMKGLAMAFRDPAVQAALPAAGEHGVAVALVQWAGRHQQVVAIDWTLLTDAASADAFAERIEHTGRWLLGETAIADAISFGVEILNGNGLDGFRRTIDISGDGVTNSGRDPDLARDAAVLDDITINGLAIVNETPDLDRYYREHVIGGPGAFLIAAKDYQDFTQAIRQKLIKEITGAPLSGLETKEPRLAKAGR